MKEDCKLQIANCELSGKRQRPARLLSDNLQFAICNLQFAICNAFISARREARLCR